MATRFAPAIPRFPHMLHGGDYNPDQWLDQPEIIDDDFRMARIAHVNTFSVAIFAWGALEPAEGEYNFGWLDRVMDKMAAQGMTAVLATPSGARPAWMAQKYPEVLRVTPEGARRRFGHRHNHCFTSPVYREKCREINKRLAERYRDHPALGLWHASNEYSGNCHCDLCVEAFRRWLRLRYDNDLDNLNRSWWTSFWSKTYTDWTQINPPSPLGDTMLHGHELDWRRFTTHQTIDFFRDETSPLRRITPDVPVTTNFMGTYQGLDYVAFSRAVDVVTWDAYPRLHGRNESFDQAVWTSFVHDLYRSMKGGKPFLMMESTPSSTNWMDVMKLKRPNLHLLMSLQAVAHGSDSVQYFQWRKGRGGPEKFHGAVVDHAGHEHTRVFGDVTGVGAVLAKLDDVVGTSVEPQVAVLYDWENGWAISGLKGLFGSDERKNYTGTCVDHYRPFWAMGIPVDVVDQDAPLSKYKLVVAPMLYLLKPGMAAKLREFVKAGGTLVSTYWSAVVDHNDACFTGGVPGDGLREVFGIWAEEIDALYPDEKNGVVMSKDNPLGMSGTYEARDLCELVHSEGATVAATYTSDFYAGMPALTVNGFGGGSAIYMTSRNDRVFLSDFYLRLAARLGLKRVLESELPDRVTAQMRTDGVHDYVFVLNFDLGPRSVDLGGEQFTDMVSGEHVCGTIELESYGSRVLRRNAAAT